jgi:hypothetical protein
MIIAVRKPAAASWQRAMFDGRRVGSWKANHAPTMQRIGHYLSTASIAGVFRQQCGRSQSARARLGQMSWLARNHTDGDDAMPTAQRAAMDEGS